MALPAFDVTINGQGLSDYGLYGASTDGLGLSTYGFVWSCSAIWSPADELVTTTWIDCVNPNSNVETCED